jgi:hypothetical protein
VGLFIYAYCFFYYFNHSGMSGFLQTAFYFLYMADVAFAFFLMMGAVGFYSAFAFVNYIYGCVRAAAGGASAQAAGPAPKLRRRPVTSCDENPRPCVPCTIPLPAVFTPANCALPPTRTGNFVCRSIKTD